MPTQTKKRTTPEPQQAVLDPAILASIPDVDHDPELLSVVSRLHALNREMATVQEALNTPG